MSSIFTENQLQKFESSKDGPDLFRDENGKMYGDGPQRGSDCTYIDTIIVLKASDASVMSYTARSYYWDTDTNEYTVVENDFIINNAGSEYLIDYFINPN